MLVESGSPSVVDSSSLSLADVVLGNNTLSDFCSVLAIEVESIRLLASGCL